MSDYIIRARHLFDGQELRGETGFDVLVRDERISQVAPSGTIEAGPETTVIDCGDRTVLPGLIDVHVHFGRTRTENEVTRAVESAELRLIRSVNGASALLNAGFTAARDVGGMHGIHIRDAIDEGEIPGPLIHASGPTISQTAGHGDIHFLPVEWVESGRIRAGLIADGPDACRRAVRLNLRVGANHIKIMTSGGIATLRDHPKWPQFSPEEIAAIVDEANRWGRTVAAHAGGEGIRQAVLGGVKTIEHGYYMDEANAELMAKHDAILVPTLLRLHLGVTVGPKVGASEWLNRKFAEAWEASLAGVAMARTAGVRIALGTDLGLRPHTRHGTNWQEAELLVQAGLNPVEALQAGTYTSAQAMGLENEIGTLAPDKYADLIVVEGNPAEDITALGRVSLVMQHGRVVRNDMRA